MTKNRIDVLLLWISIISFLMMSATFLLMPLDSMIPFFGKGFVTVAIGICFWTFFLIGIAVQIILTYRRKAWHKAHRINVRRSSARVGIIAFFTNIPASAADIIMVISLIGFTVSLFITNASGYVCYVFLSVLSFSFCMHCILNGKIYHHITNYYDVRNKHEHKNAKEIICDDKGEQ